MSRQETLRDLLVTAVWLTIQSPALPDGPVPSTGEDDANAALREYLQLVQQNPSDLAAHAGAGQAYMELGRFREAITEFELVLPNYVGERSLLPAWLAYSYLAVGEDQKAEALLVSRFGRESGARQLQQFRDAASKFKR